MNGSSSTIRIRGFGAASVDLGWLRGIVAQRFSMGFAGTRTRRYCARWGVRAARGEEIFRRVRGRCRAREPHAAAALFGGEAEVEDAVAEDGREHAALVEDIDAHLGERGVRRVEPRVEFDGAARGARLDRVAKPVADDGEEGARGHLREGWVGAEGDGDLPLFGEGADGGDGVLDRVEHRAGRTEERGHVTRARAHHRLDQVCHPLERVGDVAELFGGGVLAGRAGVGEQARAREVEPAQRAVEQVRQFVRHDGVAVGGVVRRDDGVARAGGAQRGGDGAGARLGRGCLGQTGPISVWGVHRAEDRPSGKASFARCCVLATPGRVLRGASPP